MNSSPFRARVHLLLIVAVLASFGFALWSVGVTQAATNIGVNSFADAVNSSDHACTLREAIIAANKDLASSGISGECPAGSGADTIILPPGTYTLTRTDNGNEDSASTGDLDIKSSLIISPTGPVTITAVSGFKDRIFQIMSGNVVTLTGVTIKNGNSTYGGAIYNSGTLTVTNTTLTGNKSGVWGGGIKNLGTLNLINVTISGNSSKQDGGGLYNYSGTATLTNVTIASNIADSDANGSGNGGGIAVRSGSVVNIKNTLIAGNLDKSSSTKHPDCSGTLTSQGNNLVGIKTTGCSGVTNGVNGDQAGTTSNPIDPKLGSLQNNGGPTFTHALGAGSPAIDAGTNIGCPATDQRGLPRPVGLACDIGAYEVQDAPQPGPIFTVNTAIINVTSTACTFGQCSLRDAINAANARPNDNGGSTPDEIRFALPGSGPYVIQPPAALPPITEAVIIDGTSQPGVVLDGTNAGNAGNCQTSGLTLASTGSTIRALEIRNFSGDGVRVLSGANNTITSNRIYANGCLGVNLGSDGVTANDILDSDAGANNLQNFPALFAAIPGSGNTTIEGRLDGAANTTFTLEFFSAPTCDSSGFGEGQTFLQTAAPVTVTTDGQGNKLFQATVSSVVPNGQFVSATATDPNGNTSEFSQCAGAGPDNDSWPTAFSLDPSGQTAQFDQYIDRQGQSRWFKFSIQPGSKVIVTLTNLPANYDLTIYKDINAVYQSLTDPASQDDLVHLGAEFAADAFSADRFSADAFSADRFSADAFSADRFSADRFSADRFSADAFSADRFSADIFSADAFSADRFSADRFSADRFSADRFSADRFSEEAFSTAQLRSLLGGSGFDGTASEGLRVNTWNNTGDFYVRVRGRNGAFSLDGQFHLTVTLLAGQCGNVNPLLGAGTPLAITGDYKTLILTDQSRMPDTPVGKLQDLADRPEVDGVVIDVSADPRVVLLNGQADDNVECPFAKNLVAQAIKDIVDAYRASHALEYVVIVGNDDVIPFFRHADHALLGNESNYVPPVRDATASQASLKLGYVLSQDDYGAQTSLLLNDDAFPIPDLAVGRLVETGADVTAVLNAYLSTLEGVVTPATAPLVTGYDFLTDAAISVTIELETGTGLSADTLITDVAPPGGWTADDLRGELFLGGRHDLIFLAGHFSANGALAADFTTRVQSTELASAPADFTNAVIFSIGCHSGYNIVDEHGIPVVTVEPDWAQAFAQRGATLIAGTGYQYGDTDFLEYSERLYLEFSRQLRTGPDDVAIGKALAQAKQVYLAETLVMRGLHEKALLEATLFGLPMLKVNMTGARLPAGVGASSGISPIPVPTTTPGGQLGLNAADLLVTPTLTSHTVPLSDTVNPSEIVMATYFSGSNGVVANNAEPVLPLEVRNVTVPGTVLRGVGFRGGAYSNTPNITPLVGVATTELVGVHTPFPGNTFYPCRPWSINYFDALANGSGGVTNLMVTPAQFLSSSPTALDGTLRLWQNMNFRLYYSNYLGDATHAGAAAAPPAITRVSSTVGGGLVTFTVQVVGDPAAGIQQVWVTWTDTSNPSGGQWQSIDLTQDPNDSRLWQGVLPLGSMDPAKIRFVAQAVNGVGLVNLATNLCAYFIPGVDGGPTVPTSLSPVSPASGSGPYGTQATFSAVLTSNETPLSGQPVNFSLGPVSHMAITDEDGVATATLRLLGTPDVTPYEVQAVFGGTADLIPSFSTGSFTIAKQGTTLTLDPSSASGNRGVDGLTHATLKDATGRPLGERTVFFVVTGPGGDHSEAVITDYAGRAALGALSLPPGPYTVNVYFSGNVTLPDAGVTLHLDDARYLPTSTSGSLTLVNRPPVADDDAYEVNEDSPATALAVLGNDHDPDGDTLSVTAVSDPPHGSAGFTVGGVTYTPDPNYFGPDSFTYTISDGFGGTDTAAVAITVESVNDAPSFTKGTDPVVNEDAGPQTVAGWATGINAGADNESGQVLTFEITGNDNPGLFGVSPAVASDGTLTYTPADDANGVAHITLVLKDDGGVANGGADMSESQSFTITVNPNLIYAVQDQDANDTQFFTITADPSHTVAALGPLQPDRDIEGIDLHPTTGVLYAASGKDALAGERGCLYTVDKNNGALTRIGCTGLAGVQGLSFRPDETLWGWAQGKGLITINMSTGAATVVMTSNKSGDGIAWSNDGAVLYMVAGRNLFVYNPTTNKITQVANNLPSSNVEGLEMRPDGLLAVGVHASHTIYAYDVVAQQLVPGEAISTPYDDVESIAWPF